MKRNVFSSLVVALTVVMAFILPGCVEHRYYHGRQQYRQRYEHRYSGHDRDHGERPHNKGHHH